MNKFYFFIFLLLLFSINTITVKAFSAGISPEVITFEQNKNNSIQSASIVLFNPNNYSVQFNIKTCNETLFDYLRSGIIKNNSYRIIHINHKNNKNNIKECFVDISFNKSDYMAAFSIDVDLGYNIKPSIKSNTNKILGQFWNNDIIDNKAEYKPKKDYRYIIISSVIFIIFIIFIIFKEI